MRVPVGVRRAASSSCHRQSAGGTVEDLHLFRRWTEAAIRNLSGQLDRDGLLQAARETVEFQHYFVERIEERRKAPQDDILSKVVNASLDDEQPLSHAEALSMLQQILVAGNETTCRPLPKAYCCSLRIRISTRYSK